jgi:hypothetical protein
MFIAHRKDLFSKGDDEPFEFVVESFEVQKRHSYHPTLYVGLIKNSVEIPFIIVKE